MDTQTPRTEMSEEKLASAVLYLLRGCRVRPGLTQMLKMLYYADYWHYQRHLSPITGAPYVAEERGPVIDEYWTVFGRLEDEGLIATEQVAMAGHPGRPKQEFVPKVEPDEGLFTETELETLNHVIRECGEMTGIALSDKTHREGPWSFIWDAKDPGRPIPYIAFRWLTNLPGESDLDLAKSVIAEEDVAREIEALNGADAPN